MTPFSLLIQACGLSLGEAAAYLGVRKDTAASWATGRRTAGPDVLRQLRDLYGKLVHASENAIEIMDTLPPAKRVMGYPADDHEAQALGVPCVGAWRAMAAMVIGGTMREDEIVLVPRGSTSETAAAMDAHGL